ncbi:MAG TPA: class II aldolase/adducin family protein [Acetobacteraceae bacterium]|nr:class II aldolase/adducin family protein [Acetobacteraceae bacterium]
MTREALAAAYRALGQAGLIHGNSGNVSVRTERGMLISPTGTTPERISAESVVEMGFDAPVPAASSEWALHAAIYQGRPEFGAIVHTHADACTALACLGLGLPAFHYMIAGFGGDDVRCAPYVTFGTPELADVAAAAMRGRTACLLANHGMIAAGPDLAAAIGATETLERLCRQYLLARAAGKLRILTAAEMRATRERFKTYGQR